MQSALETFRQEAYLEDAKEAHLINDAYDQKLSEGMPTDQAMLRAITIGEAVIASTIPNAPGQDYETSKKARRFWMFTNAYLLDMADVVFRYDMIDKSDEDYVDPPANFNTHSEEHKYNSDILEKLGEFLQAGDPEVHGLLATAERSRVRSEHDSGASDPNSAIPPSQYLEELATNAAVCAMDQALDSSHAIELENERSVSGVINPQGAEPGADHTNRPVIFILSRTELDGAHSYVLRVYRQEEKQLSELALHRIWQDDHDRHIQTIEPGYQDQGEQTHAMLNFTIPFALMLAKTFKTGPLDFEY